ncbi:MAG: TetR family transcriptional regulator [Rhodobacteraceae bacterium]|nr:MAG: TetR family transcriptional regulator [Paracoccaceae bacterium]
MRRPPPRLGGGLAVVVGRRDDPAARRRQARSRPCLTWRRPRAGRRRAESKETRAQQLIDAAMRTIAMHGLAGAITALLTERAGLSAGIIDLRFGSKDKLLAAALERLVMAHRAKSIAAARNPMLDPAARLWAPMEAHFAHDVRTPTRIAVWFACFGEARRRARCRRISESFDTERTDFMESCGEALMAGSGAPGLDPERFAQLIESAADGLCLDMPPYPDEVGAASAREQMRAFFPRRFAPPEAAR